MGLPGLAPASSSSTFSLAILQANSILNFVVQYLSATILRNVSRKVFRLLSAVDERLEFTPFLQTYRKHSQKFTSGSYGNMSNSLVKNITRELIFCGRAAVDKIMRL